MNVVDIFDVDNIDSVVRKHWAESGVVDLSQFNIPSFILPSDYTMRELHLPKENYNCVILKNIQKMLKIADIAGFDRMKLTSPVFEGCRNAHQHGNGLDPNKKVTIGYNIIPNISLDIVIIDEGGKINPDFFPYLLRHRQGLHRINHVNFYDFCNKKHPANNQGEGTLLIHSTYLDAVHFYKSENNGLVLHLSKIKNVPAYIHDNVLQ